ncbi:EAL domain-containing response regulator [Pseudomonas turukhanskensis]|uniref:Transcriptional regulator n=1 Tax=Pseudomonas turukhanskensis TaxID=1806536 RepID=A0A9W6K8M3_9PSED|nr:EAL domain-containing protein [Pseudomonas turukhanskensis]GLK88973.1 transcriptional regulator [Pseudomonas turukhanskensis]
MAQPKILISQDHPLAQQALAATLKSLGYSRLFIAETYQNAIDLARDEGNFDIFICTITAPNAHELHLLNQIQTYGRINYLLLINEMPSYLLAPIRKIANNCQYTVLAELGKPFTKMEVQSALLKYRPDQGNETAKAAVDTFPAKVIANAAEKNQFIPFYQPKVNLQTMEVIGAEILMRWNHPNWGILGPGAFMDIAKRFGHIDAMMLDILDQALTWTTEQQFDKDFKLAVNVDAIQLCKPDFHKKIAEMLNDKKFPGHNLILEVTECGILKSPIVCMTNLIQLRLLDCGVSIDDFGVGLSSLQRVCDLPCTELKLDMSFAQSIPYNQRSRLAVANMAKLSKEMDIQLVAEGIETTEQLHLLQKMGCPVGQGYLFSPPVSAKNLLKWLKHHEKYRSLKKNN